MDAVVGQLTMPRVQQLGGRVARPCQVIQDTQQDGCQVVPATESPLSATCPQQKTWDTAEHFMKNDYKSTFLRRIIPSYFLVKETLVALFYDYFALISPK